jgi:hypothetical protein
MKESEFYERAFRDADFRHEKLEELRYSKKVGVVLLWFIAGAGVAFLSYAIWRKGWDADFGWLAPAALCVGSYSTVVTRVAALEAIEKEQNQSRSANSRRSILPSSDGG